MNNKILLLAASAAILVAGAVQAASLTVIPSYVDPSGSHTSVLGINNAGWMTGNVSSADFSTSRGFSRDAAGNYTLFALPGETSTFGRGIDNANNVYGYATDSSGSFANDIEFMRTSGGVVTTLVNPGTSVPLHGIAQGANDGGAIVGDYIPTPAGLTPKDGFVLNGATFTDISVDARTSARAIENNGTVAGWASIIGGFREGFIDVLGVITTYQDPHATVGNQGTIFEDINNNGVVAGMWVDSFNNDHAFQFNSVTNIFTEISVTGATNVEAFGLNDHGDEVLHASNFDTGYEQNFLYSANGVPEPATWAMMLTGFFGLGSVLRRRRVALAV
jgi:hypothetical protein